MYLNEYTAIKNGLVYTKDLPDDLIKVIDLSCSYCGEEYSTLHTNVKAPKEHICHECTKIRESGGSSRVKNGRPRVLTKEGRYAKSKMAQYKKAAKDRGYGFDMSFEQFSELLIRSCHYCGIYNHLKMGVDRVSNNIGYNTDNTVSCCKQCNMSKHARSVEDFIEHARRIYEHTSGELTEPYCSPVKLYDKSGHLEDEEILNKIRTFGKRGVGLSQLNRLFQKYSSFMEHTLRTLEEKNRISRSTTRGGRGRPKMVIRAL